VGDMLNEAYDQVLRPDDHPLSMQRFFRIWYGSLQRGRATVILASV